MIFSFVLFSKAHSPDNTFLGFVVNAAPPSKAATKRRRKAKALVYGKHYNMWKVRINHPSRTNVTFSFVYVVGILV